MLFLDRGPNITALGNDIELYRIDGGQEDGDCAAGTITVTVSEIHSTSAEAVFVNNYTENYEVDMPIVRAVDAIVNHNADPRTVVARLMERDKTAERKG